MAKTLAKHFGMIRNRLIAYGDHVGLANHGDVKGLAREGILKQFLQANLPSMVEFKTGEIVDPSDNRSGQLDIVVQASTSPRINLVEDIQITLADAAIAAIEVKSTLTTASWNTSSHLKSALETFQKVKALQRKRYIRSMMTTGIEVVHTTTPCFLFAYYGPELDTLLSKIIDYGKHYSIPIEQYAPEVITVIDRGYYICKDNGWLFPPINGGPPFRDWRGNPEECMVGQFVYLCQLIESWNSQNNPTPFGSYF